MMMERTRPGNSPVSTGRALTFALESERKPIRSILIARWRPVLGMPQPTPLTGFAMLVPFNSRHQFVPGHKVSGTQCERHQFGSIKSQRPVPFEVIVASHSDLMGLEFGMKIFLEHES
jgi:hypothetical protein